MSNVQLWNTEWSSTDVSNDFNDITDVITSQPATALIARYQLTQNLEGTETKASHAASEPLTPTLNISFTDGAAGDSFVATDYHTFGVVDGMLKDNAISLSQRNSLYYKPTDFDFGVFENATSSNTVSSATVQVTEPVRFANLSSSASIDTQFNNRSGNSTAGLQAYPGEISLNSTQGDSGHNTNGTTTVGAMSIQPITDDGYIQFTPNTTAVDVIVGFSPQGWDDPNHAATNGKFAHTIHINSSNVVQIWEDSNQNVIVANAHTHVLGDTYRIIRTGTAVKYEVEDASGTITTLHDSTLISDGTVYARFGFHRYNSLVDVLINYTRPEYIMNAGSSVNMTGASSEDFIAFDTERPQHSQIQLNGVEAVIHSSNELYDLMTVPAPGEVTINPSIGWVVCNPADDGAIVTGSLVAVFDQV